MNLVFDIGFNLGQFAQVCMEKHPNCKIVALEANPTLTYGFEPQTGEWADPKFFQEDSLVLLNYLVSDKSEEYLDFFFDDRHHGIGTACKEWISNSRFGKGSKYVDGSQKGSWPYSIIVPTITLDNLVDKYGMPDLIKIDVEGYEDIVLKGLTKKTKKICFEWVEELYAPAQNCLDHLKSLGYAEFGVVGYFEDAVPSIATSDPAGGDNHMREPEEYFSYEEINKWMNFTNMPDRRINWGMIWAK